MQQLDRYIIRQVTGPFLFFILIFGGIIWLNQSLKIIDLVVDNGQGGLVFLEFSLLLVPRILEMAVPVAGFAAALYLTNRLFVESELVVMMGAGNGPVQITRPFWLFGLASFILMSLVSHLLLPWATQVTQDKQLQMRKEFLAKTVVEGEFISPTEGLTLFFGETNASGELTDVFIHDTRDPAQSVTHSAQKGQVVVGEDAPSLILFDGLIQRFDPAMQSLSTIQFESFSYDLTQFIKEDLRRKVRPDELSTWDLIVRSGEEQVLPGVNRGVLLAEGHRRFVKALLGLIVPALGAVVLLSGKFQRTGFVWRILGAICLMAALNTLSGLAEQPVVDNPGSWPLLYLPPFLGLICIGIFLAIAVNPKRQAKARSEGQTS